MKSLLDCGRRGLPLPIPGITDLHAHLGRIGFAIPDLSPASVVRVMDRLGVERMVCSHMRCMSADVREGNRQILAAMREFPGRILGYVSLWPCSPAAVRDEVRRAFEDGFVGLKVHNSTGFSYRHPSFAPAYALAHRLRRPVLFHTWGENPVLEEIRALAREYPGMSILLGHAGCCNEAAYLEAARACPNIYLETCFSRAPRGLIERLVLGAGAGRVVWGSDALFYSQSQQIGRVLGARIGEEEMRQVLALNAKRILEQMRQA